jgi:hypothetical protein
VKVSPLPEPTEHENLPAPNFPISEDALQSASIEPVHTGNARISISCQTIRNKVLFLLVQKLGILRPICNEKECNNCNSDGSEAFNDENPIEVSAQQLCRVH